MRHSIFFEQASSLKAELERLRPQLATAAQEVYDEWQPDGDGVDEVYGGGGICDQVSSAMAEVIAQLPDVETTEGGQDGDDHSWLIAYRGDEAYGVDIPPGVYERGGGYRWTKIPNVTIRPDHVDVFPVDVPDADWP